MSLTQELGDIRGDKLTYMLMRVSGVDTGTAKRMLQLKEGTYNTWLRDPNSHFVSIHRRIPELTEQYRDEAFLMLRENNQLSAILLEGEILAEMREEVRIKTYKLVKTNLARTVYERVLDSMEKKPASGSWGDRLNQMFNFFNIENPQNPSAEVIDATTNRQTATGILTQPAQSQVSEEGDAEVDQEEIIEQE
ncbi:MAG: hypothetical protein ACWGQW_00595 [bacterium]